MPDEFVSVIEPDRVAALQPSHAGNQVSVGRFQNQVIMVAHQATPDKVKKYDADVTVALLSIAMKRDLFSWFREQGVDVDASKSPIQPRG